MEGQSSHVVSVVQEKSLTEGNINTTKSIICWISNNWKAVLAELVSTSLLVLFGCMSCIPLDGYELQPPMYAPFGFGLAVLFNIQIFGHISGAHMNPSVTVAAWILGLTPLPLAVVYIIVQCIGSIFGYGVLLALSPTDLVPGAVCVTLPHEEHNLLQSFSVEMLLTATLILICCGVWDPVNEIKQDSTPIRFGLAIAGLSIAGGPLTGASMNSARSLGPALWTSRWEAHWVYWVGPLVGSVLASIIYKYVWLNSSEKSKKLVDN